MILYPQANRKGTATRLQKANMVYVATNLNGLLLIHIKGTLRVSVADTWGRMQFSNCCIAIAT